MLILVVTGPLAARYTQPAVERLGAVVARRRRAWAPEARADGAAAGASAAGTPAGPGVVLPAQGAGVEPVEDSPDAEDALDAGPDQALDGLSR